MSLRHVLRAGLLLATTTTAVAGVGERLGGDASVRAFGNKSYALPIGSLGAQQLRDSFFGNRLFNTNWTQAPGSVAAFDGLGPLYNRVSCSACHVRDGRGQPPEQAGALLQSMILRLSVPGRTAQGGVQPHPVYGDQLQDQAILGVPAEGQVWMDWQDVAGRFGDGAPYTLLRPLIELRGLAYGPVGAELLMSPRVAPAMIGLGLLDALPEEEVLAAADPDDRDGDGISGRPNRVWDAATGSLQLGRFGWKANVASLRAQITGAAAGDLGLTSALRPQDACMPLQDACREAHNGGQPELPEVFIDKLQLYLQTLAVPMRRAIDAPEVLRGETLFAERGCAGCHRPTLTTGPQPIAALSQQTIHPYSDLLLHDMGEGLADGRPDGAADGREWRTPPLWGIGLLQQVNGHTRLLHDGRARGLEEAVLWHGGEAARSREAYLQMDAADRSALLRFLESL